MKKPLSFLAVLLVMLWCAVGTDSAGLWAKYVAPDGNCSFHYPSGWKVTYSASIVAIDNKQTDEQLLMAGVPFDSRKTPAALAAGFIVLLKDSNPNVRAFNWVTEPKTADSLVLFELSDEADGKQYSGAGYVAKTAQDATWFSYVAPVAGFFKARCFAILEGFIGSLASGSASKTPSIDYTADPSANMDRNAQAFMFVLEFALGAPFTQAQEGVILDELKTGWRTLSEAELKKYDQYPALVQTILKLGKKDLEVLRADLEKTIKEWLAESDQSDQAVRIIRNQLQTRGRVVIAGDPPLTEMSGRRHFAGPLDLPAGAATGRFAGGTGENPEPAAEAVRRNPKRHRHRDGKPRGADEYGRAQITNGHPTDDVQFLHVEPGIQLQPRLREDVVIDIQRTSSREVSREEVRL